MAGKYRTKKTRLESLTCKSATSLIAEYITADIDPEVGVSFENHLRACPDCVAFLNTYRKTLELTRSFLAMESAESRLERVKARVLKELRNKKEPIKPGPAF